MPSAPPEESILVLDDERDAAESLARALCSLRLAKRFHVATGLSEALETAPAVAVVDLNIDPSRGPSSGIEAISVLRARIPGVRIIVLTGHGCAELGVRALRAGAASFLEKPADVPHLAALIRDALAQARLFREHEALLKDLGRRHLAGIAGGSRAASLLRREIEYAAFGERPVLIHGETGTGKGLCAASIHSASKRASREMVRYQPGSSGPEMVASELFGHAKGAFTGASEARRGLLARADGGTLFLDEVDELPLSTQVALLGALQDGRFRPLGCDAETESRFRLICATNRDPLRCVEQGRLRADFFHRVSHGMIRVPPLRERREDIPELAEGFLRAYRSLTGASVFAIEPAAVAELCEREWRGNVRELEAVVIEAAERAAFERKETIQRFARVRSGEPGRESFESRVRRFKRALVEEALRAASGNRSEAARSLGMDRSALRRAISSLAAKNADAAPG